MAYDEFQDRHYDEVATVPDAIREFAWAVGYEKDNIGQAWLLSDYDTWTRNPHYRGPPVSHPEDEDRFLDYPVDPPNAYAIDEDEEEDLARMYDEGDDLPLKEDHDLPF